MSEQWEPGDVVLAADGALWRYVYADTLTARGLRWALLRVLPPSPGGHLAAEDVPMRPLVLLVRNGKPMLLTQMHQLLEQWDLQVGYAFAAAELREALSEYPEDR